MITTFNFSPDVSSLSEQQKSVIAAFESGKNILVTGGAGTGKSYLLSFLKRNYGPSRLEVTASTGIAAVNIGGSTIYSWAGIGLANMPLDKIIGNIFTAKFSKLRRKIKQARGLAIDEISMISAEVFAILDKVFQAVRENNMPMGGMQIVLFGDFLQLPPIMNNQNSGFCFDSEAWRNLDLQVFNLQKTFRQSDDRFINLLNNLRFGKVSDEDKKLLESRLKADDTSQAIKPTILTTHNYKVEKINQDELKKIPYQEVSHQATYDGSLDKIEFLKRNCLAADSLRLKVGSQVMMIKNTFQKEGIINGSLGIVKDFSPRKSYPIVEFANGKTIIIGPEEWLLEKFDEEKGRMVVEASLNQVPLILAWAMTIHKSQGLTLDKISCDLSEAFSPGQIYVALSRARSLSGVFIESINFNKILCSRDAVKFYDKLDEAAI